MGRVLIKFSKGEKITVKAHGGPIDIQGITVAKVNDKVQLQSVETWFDPLEMFRQISPDGAVERKANVLKEDVELATQLDEDETPSSESAQKQLDVKPDIPESVREIHKEMRNASSAECPFLAKNN